MTPPARRSTVGNGMDFAALLWLAAGVLVTRWALRRGVDERR